MRTSRWPISHLPISDITPFTYRDGETYLELLNRLSKYITEQLHPNLRKTVEHMVEEMEHIIAAQHGKYVEGVQDFQRIHDAFMTDVNSALMALNDNAVADLADDPGTVFGAKLRELFPSRAGFDALDTQIREDFATLQQTVEDTVDAKTDATTSSVTHYVSPAGNDATGDGTEGNPFKTVNRAISHIPDHVRQGHAYNITLAPGEYDEDVQIRNKVVNGTIMIGGDTDERADYRIHSFLANQITGHLHLRNVKTTIKNIEGGRGIEFRASGPFMLLSNVESTVDDGEPRVNSRAFLADYGSIVRIRDSDFSGKRYGIRSNYQSQVYATNCTGEGNVVGAAARWGARLSAYYEDLPDGRSPLSTNSGGIISLGHGGIIGDIGTGEIAVAGFENYRDNGPTAKQYLLNRFTVPLYMVADTPLASGSTLRARFRAPRDGVPMRIRVSWLSRASVSGVQAHESVHQVLFRQNTILGNSQTVSSYGVGMAADDAVTVTARGSFSDFYVTVNNTLSLDSDSWALRVDIECEDTETPFLSAVERQ